MVVVVAVWWLWSCWSWLHCGAGVCGGAGVHGGVGGHGGGVGHGGGGGGIVVVLVMSVQSPLLRHHGLVVLFLSPACDSLWHILLFAHPPCLLHKGVSIIN